MVANEVRKLAEETLAATREVRNQISTIQKATREGVHAMSLSSEAVRDGSAQADAVKQEFMKNFHIMGELKAILVQLADQAGDTVESAQILQQAIMNFGDWIQSDVQARNTQQNELTQLHREIQTIKENFQV